MLYSACMERSHVGDLVRCTFVRREIEFLRDVFPAAITGLRVSSDGSGSFSAGLRSGLGRAVLGRLERVMNNARFDVTVTPDPRNLQNSLTK